MKELFRISVICFILTFSLQSAFAQENTLPKGRYVVVENHETYFSEVNGNIEIRDFLLYNVNDDESSKPVFIDVNELSNVVKFSISSSSENIAGTRRCTVIMNKPDYRNTFYKVLRKMQVESVVLEGVTVSIENFYKFIIEQ